MINYNIIIVDNDIIKILLKPPTSYETFEDLM